jgi:hypothetical protein
MTQTRIRVGRIAIEGMTGAAAGNHTATALRATREGDHGAFGIRLQAAIAAALRQPVAAAPMTLSLPHLRLTLPHGATDADVVAAVANALRDAIARPR